MAGAGLKLCEFLLLSPQHDHKNVEEEASWLLGSLTQVAKLIYELFPGI